MSTMHRPIIYICFALHAFGRTGEAVDFFELRNMSLSGLSSDGSTVVGSGNGSPVFWTEKSGMAGITPLPGQDRGVAYGASANGTVIVGASFGPTSDMPFIWTVENGTEAIDIPERFTNGQLGNLSDDANFGAGTLYRTDGGGRVDESSQAAYWTRKDGMQSLGMLPGFTSSEANFGGISADGTVVVGRVQKRNGDDYFREAIMWTQATGMQGLGTLPGTVSSSAADISADGVVIVGNSGEPNSSLSDQRAFRWTSEDGMSDLGFPEGSTAAAALGTNGDGSVVVGSHTSNDQLHAMVWDAVNGMRDFRQVLIEEHGFSNIPFLQRASHISDDAMTIAGSFPGFVVKLDRPLVVTTGVLGDFNGNAELDVEDLDLLAKELRSDRNVDLFDVNSDSVVNVEDRRHWVHSLANTYFGDSNLDGEFNTKDLVAIFEAGEYEDELPMNSTWATGDWNGDGEFSTSDLVVAFEDGGYELGPRAAVQTVPEPATAFFGGAGLFILALVHRRPAVRCAHHTNRAH